MLMDCETHRNTVFILELMSRLSHGQKIQTVFQLLLCEKAGVLNQLPDRNSCFQRLFGNICRLFISNIGTEGGCQGNAGLYQLFAPFSVGCNAKDAVVNECTDSTCHGVNGFKNFVEYYRLKCI